MIHFISLAAYDNRYFVELLYSLLKATWKYGLFTCMSYSLVCNKPCRPTWCVVFNVLTPRLIAAFHPLRIGCRCICWCRRSTTCLLYLVPKKIISNILVELSATYVIFKRSSINILKLSYQYHDHCFAQFLLKHVAIRKSTFAQIVANYSLVVTWADADFPNGALGNKRLWNLNQSTIICNRENAFEIVVYQNVAICFRSHCFNMYCF